MKTKTTPALTLSAEVSAGIAPVTVTVTLTGRKAAAYRRAVKYDKLTEQQAAEVALVDYVSAFTDMEDEWRSKAKRQRTGVPEPLLVSDEFAGRIASGVVARLEAANAGGAR